MQSEQLQIAIAMLRESGFSEHDWATQRAEMEAMTVVSPPPDEAVFTPTDADGVPCEIVTMPSSRDDRWIMYTHGGAYVSGSLRTHARYVAMLAGATDTTLLNVDYRLAPEHPHPAAVDDAVRAYRWLVRGRGVSPHHIVLAGDSAGGGLAAATLVTLRDAGDPLPAGAALMSPWADLTLSSESVEGRAALDPLCQPESLGTAAAAYLGRVDPKSPLASPRYADLSGLPPLLIHVGDHEILLDDSTGLADQARSSGVDVELMVAPEMIHVWHLFAGNVPESDDALAAFAAWIRARL
jgi:acetyl esterase/lipase